MDFNPSRRQVLTGIGTTAAVGGLGAASLLGGASATAGSSIADPTPVTSDDGEITYVAVQSTGRVSWDGFDTPARKARILSYVTLSRGGSELWSGEIHDTGKFDLTGEWGGSGEETYLNGDHHAGQSGHIASDVDWGICQRGRQNLYNGGYGLPSSPAPTDYFYADGDGSTKKTKVTLRTEYRLYNENGQELTGTSGYPDRPEGEASFVVTVNNEEATTTSGTTDAEGDSTDSATVGV
jgi:hypothetical protein